MLNKATRFKPRRRKAVFLSNAKQETTKWPH